MALEADIRREGSPFHHWSGRVAAAGLARRAPASMRSGQGNVAVVRPLDSIVRRQGSGVAVGRTSLEDLVENGFKVIWGFLAAYWIWSARSVKASSRTESSLLQLAVYWAPLIVAFVLLGPGAWFEGSILSERFVPKSEAVKWLGLAITTAGIFLACWSRHVLGRNWSSVVQLKQEHELVASGPYLYIRHPIYTGLLLAFLGTALKVGDWRGLIAVAIVFASFWRKLRLEERWLSEQFGTSYTAYVQRTKALVPGVL